MTSGASFCENESDIQKREHRSMSHGSRLSLTFLLGSLAAGCAFVPVQETTLKNANGGSVTCKQTGTGVVSASVGKKRYQECIDKAHADGYQ
jgi:hypothetical protein